jgi:hypothetical protein
MLKKYVAYLIAGLLLFGPLSRSTQAAPQKDKQPVTVEEVKTKIAKIGLGEKARATITLKDGKKTKGYIARADQDDFVIRDRKSDTPTTIRYADVARVEQNKGHSTAKHVGLGVGIGVGAFVGILLIIFSRLED